jgi:Kef-type K+ transport system membrane component KefB
VAAGHTTAIFAAQLILLLFFGRMFGEIMSRAGQPAIFGQRLAGVMLGPSIFGSLLPEIRHMRRDQSLFLPFWVEKDVGSLSKVLPGFPD